MAIAVDPARLAQLPVSQLLAVGGEAYRLAVERAKRGDFHTFLRLVLRDMKGQPIEYAPIHRCFAEFVQWCHQQGYYAGALGPVQHGKTGTLVEGLSLWEIGRDLNVRIRIVSGDDPEATKRLSVVARYIDGTAQVPEYREIFPNVRPGQKAEWSRHRLYVQRPSSGRDPTLEASAVMGAKTGAGHDLIIFDDIVSAANTIRSPATRPQVYEQVEFWLQRVQPHTRVLLTGFRHHRDDAYGRLMVDGGPRWRWLIIRVSDDFRRLEAEVHSQETLRRSATGVKGIS